MTAAKTEPEVEQVEVDTRTVHERMAAVLADLSYIPKGKSPGVNYEFRGIDALMNHLHPVLAAHGLYLAPKVLPGWQVNAIPGSKDRTQFQALFAVEVTVWAADGSSVTLGPGLAQSHDYGDKAVYQAQQNAIKYVLLEAFCIPTAEQDMDARQADEVPAVPLDVSPLHAAIDQAEAENVTLPKGRDELVEWVGSDAGRLRNAIDRVRKAIDDARPDDPPPFAPATDDQLSKVVELAAERLKAGEKLEEWTLANCGVEWGDDVTHADAAKVIAALEAVGGERS